MLVPVLCPAYGLLDGGASPRGGKEGGGRLGMGGPLIFPSGSWCFGEASGGVFGINLKVKRVDIHTEKINCACGSRGQNYQELEV